MLQDMSLCQLEIGDVQESSTAASRLVLTTVATGHENENCDFIASLYLR